MEITKQKKKQGLPVRLTIMQRKFADLLVFHEGHKYAYECAKDAGYEGDNATLRAKSSALQNPKYYPLVIIRTGKIEDLSEDELNKRISTIMDDNDLLLDPKSKDKDPIDKKPKPILS